MPFSSRLKLDFSKPITIYQQIDKFIDNIVYISSNYT